MLEGKKTYLGLSVALLAFIAKDFLSETEAELLVISIFEISGLLFAIYGRYVANPKN